MRPVNLYLLTRNQNKNTYTPFENILSARHERVPVKEHEFQSLRHLVDILWQQGVAIPEMDGFFYSYTIRQIGKEFDLLKNRAAASKEPILSWNVSAATGAVYICGGDRETLHTQRRSVV